MCVCFLNLTRHFFHRPTGMLTVGGVSWQGSVSFAPNRTHACNTPSPRWNVACAHRWQYGGGLFISGTATLTDTNVYANQAAFYVRSPSELSSSAPRS
eukprot:scaffold10426_cov64-Phaeocystis_antarctica.AAC.2